MPYLGFMGFNISYLLFLLPGLILSIWAQIKVKSTFSKYNQVPTISGLTGAAAARRILDAAGLQAVAVERVPGSLSDNYDPRSNVVRLSDATYQNASVGAVGVAAHECGHAVQYAENYGPAKVRGALVPAANLGSSLSIPLIFIGIALDVLQLAYVGIALFSLAVLFQLVTLPVEVNASRRAIAVLENSGIVTPEENDGVRKVLSAAALTYIAALLVSLLQLLFFVTRVNSRRN